MNIEAFLTHYEENGKGSIHIGSDMTCVFNGENCPHLQCGTNRNPNRAVYHKIKKISIDQTGEVCISISPFYEERKEFNLRDLLMVTSINEIQIDDIIRIAGNGKFAYIASDDASLYRMVKNISIVEGVMFITLTPSIDDIMRMITVD